MAHNINENRMFYYGERPWHGLGTELDHPATAKEAIEAARLDYEVKLTPVGIKRNGGFVEIPDKRATVRMDTGAVLGVVGDRYQVIQNVEAFTFFDVVVGEGQAIYHTAGALGKGERVWILAKLPDNIVLLREDIIEKYLILTNSHDGTSALRMYFSPIRVVCQNTLNASLGDASQGICIRHQGDVMAKFDEARRVLGITVDYYTQFERIVSQLADVQLNVKQAEQYFDTLVYGKNPTAETLESTRLTNRKNQIMELFEGGARGSDILGVRGTLWAAYNAVAEYADYYRTVKGLSKDSTRRLSDIWFGWGARMKEKAFEEAMVIARR